jgi:hypothetical protein
VIQREIIAHNSISMFKKALIFAIFWFYFSPAIAQESDLSKEIGLMIARSDGFGPQSREKFLLLPQEQQTILFSILIEVSKLGNVESVKFTNKSSRQDSMLIYSEMIKFLKADKRDALKKYKGCFIIAPIWIRKLDGFTIDVTSNFIKSFDSLIPLESSMPKDKIMHIIPVTRYNLMDPVFN